MVLYGTLIEPKAIPPVVEAPLFSKTIIRFLSFIFSVQKHISLSDWLSPGATFESALRRPKLNNSLPHIHDSAVLDFAVAPGHFFIFYCFLFYFLNLLRVFACVWLILA